MDPFEWEQPQQKRSDAPASSDAPSDAPAAEHAPPPATVGIFAAVLPPVPAAPPQPPPVEPPPPPAPELSTSWSAHSSKAPSGGRSVKRIAVALLLVVALAAGAVVFLFGRGSGGGVALAMGFQQGASWRYRMHMSLDLTVAAGGQSLPMKADLTAGVQMKVASIDTAGVATLKLHLSNVVATMNGHHSKVPPTAIRGQTLRVAPDGHVLSATLPGVPAADTFNLVPGSDQITPLLPDGPAEPGDSWSRDITIPAPFGAGGDLHASLLVTLVRYQAVHGVRAAVIEEHGSVPIDLTLDVLKVIQALGKSAPDLPSGAHPQIVYRGTVTEEDTSWFDPAAGRVLTFSGKASLDATMSFTGLPAGATIPDLSLSGTVSMDLRQPGPGSGHHAGHHAGHHSGHGGATVT